MKYRLALVTGATSGIGQATCLLFAQQGLELIISGRNQQELQHLQESLSKEVRVEIVQADLASMEGRQRLIDVVHARVPDLVVNNAGFGLYGGALTHSTEEQVDILEVNGRALLELSLEATRALISDDKKGVILNVASVAAFETLPYMAVYAASKAFVKQFSQAFDYEVKSYGVRILTLCPGMVMTDFQRRAGGHLSEEQAGMMSASFVAEQIWKQIEMLEPLSIIDWKDKLRTYLSSLLPTGWIASIVERAINKRMTPRTIIKIKK